MSIFLLQSQFPMDFLHIKQPVNLFDLPLEVQLDVVNISGAACLLAWLTLLLASTAELRSLVVSMVSLQPRYFDCGLSRVLLRLVFVL